MMSSSKYLLPTGRYNLLFVILPFPVDSLKSALGIANSCLIEVEHIFRSTDRISYDEFEHWVLEKSSANDTHVNSGMLFTLLDKDYKGYLVVDDFCSASTSVDLNIPPSIWRTVFRELDCCKKGYLNVDEFSHVLPAV